MGSNGDEREQEPEAPLFKAVRPTSHTCIGTGDERPVHHGNCFSVADGRGGEWRILNFYYENVEALQTLGLTWPIQCKTINDYLAVVHDPRIGERWYSERYCTVCCPEALLPITQQQRHQRQELRGSRKTHVNGSVSFYFDVKAQFE